MAARFDAAGESLSRVGTGLSGTASTLAGWVYIDVDRNDFSYWFGGDNGVDQWHLVGFGSDGATPDFSTGVGTLSGTTGANTVGVWYYLAAVYDPSGTDFLYVAPLGTPTLTTAASGTVSQALAAAWTLHVGNDGFDERLDGRVAYARVWNAALTKTELEAELAATAAVRTSGLWVDLPLTSDANDISGNARHFTVNGSVTWVASPSLGGGPTAPGQVTGLSLTGRPGAVDMSWTAPSDGGSAITDYLLERAPDVAGSPGTYSTLSDGTSTATTYTDTTIVNGTKYWYRVSAINAVGTGTASTAVSVTPVRNPRTLGWVSEGGTSLGSANAQPLPTGAATGDLVIYIAGVDNPAATATTASTGWEASTEQVQGSNVIRARVFARLLTGLTGDNILSLTGAAQDYAVVGVRVPSGEHAVTSGTIASWMSSLVAGAVSSSNGNADPPNLNPAVSDDRTWIAAAVIDATTGNTISADPTNYDVGTGVTSASSTSSVVTRAASRKLTASAENPGTFTNTSRPWAAFTIGIPPFAAPTSGTVPVAAVTAVGVPPAVAGSPTVGTVPTAAVAAAGVVPTAAASGTVSGSVPTASAVAVGVVPTVPSPLPFPAAVDGTNRYWVDQFGSPWLGIGDSAWSLCAQLSTANITLYLEDRAAKGINFVLVELIEHAFSDNHPNNFYNDAPFVGVALQSALNAAYWAVPDHMMAEALRLGITIMACPAYLGFPSSDEGWDTEVVASYGVSSGIGLTNYGAALAARYPSASYPNIVWLIGHDRVPSSTEKAAEKLISDQLPAGHLKIPGGLSVRDGGSGYGKTDWASSGITFTGGDTIYTYATSDPDVPMVTVWANNNGPGGFLEGSYENEGANAEWRRESWYGTWLNGGAWALTGNNPMWHFGGRVGDSDDWQGQLSSAGYVQMSHMATLRAAIGGVWAAAVPDTTNTFQTTGGGNCRFSSSIGLVYTTTGATLDLSEISGSSARVRWFDPTAGTFTTVGTFATTAGRVIADPGANSGGAQDWVLVVDPVTTTAGTVPTAVVNLAGVVPTGAEGAAAGVVPTASAAAAAVVPVGSTGAAVGAVPPAAVTAGGVVPVGVEGAAAGVVPVAALSAGGVVPVAAVSGGVSAVVPVAAAVAVGVVPGAQPAGTVGVVPSASVSAAGLLPAAVEGSTSATVPVASASSAGVVPSASAGAVAGVVPVAAVGVVGVVPVGSSSAGPQTGFVPAASVSLSAVVPAGSASGGVAGSVPAALAVAAARAPAASASGAVSAVVPIAVLVAAGVPPVGHAGGVDVVVESVSSVVAAPRVTVSSMVTAAVEVSDAG